MENKAVIIIDMLNDFVTGKLAVERAKNIRTLRDWLKQPAKTMRQSFTAMTPYSQDVEVARKWGSAP